MKETKEELVYRQTTARFLQFDQEKMISLFSLSHDDTYMYIDFLGKTYQIDRRSAAVSRDGAPATSDEMASIFEFLTKSEHLPAPTGEWASIAGLCANTTDTSLTRYINYLKPFGDDLEKMQAALNSLGAKPASKGDVSGILEVFSGVPIWFQYWAADDEFPASVQFLFDAGIIDHFRWSLLWNVMTCITMRMKEAAGLMG